MQSKLIGVVFQKGSRRAALLMRRADGQFAIADIDARMGSAAYAAARFPARRAERVAVDGSAGAAANA